MVGANMASSAAERSQPTGSGPGPEELEEALRSAVLGSGDGPGARALYATDASNTCRTQIEHTTDRRALHLAEVLDTALQAASRSQEPA